MTKKSRWRPVLGAGLILGVVLALVMPAVAFADPPSVTVQTPGATPGPTTTNSELKTSAECPTGLISGGGISQTPGPETERSSNGLRSIGTAPSADGTTEFLGTPGVVATDVTHWLAIAGTGGATNPPRAPPSPSVTMRTGSRSLPTARPPTSPTPRTTR